MDIFKLNTNLLFIYLQLLSAHWWWNKTSLGKAEAANWSMLGAERSGLISRCVFHSVMPWEWLNVAYPLTLSWPGKAERVFCVHFLFEPRCLFQLGCAVLFCIKYKLHTCNVYVKVFAEMVAWSYLCIYINVCVVAECSTHQKTVIQQYNIKAGDRFKLKDSSRLIVVS